MNGRNSTRAVWMCHVILRAGTPLLLGIAMVGPESGCSRRDAERLAPVSGRVLLDAQPLAGATIRFSADGRQVSAITGEDGRYQLQPGAPLGACRVSVSKYDKSEANVLALDPGAAGRVRPTPATTQRPKLLIPARYSDLKQTPLRFTVAPEGTDRADFDLTGGK